MQPKKRLWIIRLALLIIFSIVAFAIASTCPSSPKQYNGQYSKLEYVVDFDLGKGQTYKQKRKEGREHLLLFWGSWCPHCENILDFIDKQEQEELILDHLFTVAVDDTLETIEPHQSEFPIYLDYNRELYRTFELEHIPTLFITDNSGKILGSAEGEAACKELLTEYLNRYSR